MPHSKLLVKKRPPNDIIHVSIRTPKSFSISKKQTSKVVPIKSEKNQSFYLNSQVTNQNASLSDRQGLTIDHHQELKQKNKYNFCVFGQRRCIVCSIATLLVITMISATVLLILLIKPKKIANTNTSAPQLRWNTTGITIAGVTDSPGNSSTQLNTPFDAIVDYTYNLYIADQRNNRIQRYSFGSSMGTTIAGNTTSGSSQYQLYNPSRIILDTNGNFYIADTTNSRIVFWRQGANLGTTIAGGSLGVGNNQLNSPYSLALHPTSGILFITDQMNSRIMSYAQGASSGIVVLGNQGPGINSTQLYYPVGLCLDSIANTLLIANSQANNVVRYVLGSNSTWELFAGYRNGSAGATSNSFNYPTAVTVDPMGNVYICDGMNHRIQFFAHTQLLGQTIAGITSVSGNSNMTLNGPNSITLDNQLNLYISDTGNHRIEKFSRY